MVAAQVAMLAVLASRPAVAASCATHLTTEAVSVNHAEHAEHGGNHGIGREKFSGDHEAPSALAFALACCNAHAVAFLPLPALRSISIFAGMPVSEQPQRLSSIPFNALDPPPRAFL